VLRLRVAASHCNTASVTEEQLGFAGCVRRGLRTLSYHSPLWNFIAHLLFTDEQVSVGTPIKGTDIPPTAGSPLRCESSGLFSSHDRPCDHYTRSSVRRACKSSGRLSHSNSTILVRPHRSAPHTAPPFPSDRLDQHLRWNA
jgi:hypothetical protein